MSYTLTGAYGLWTFGPARVESDLLMNYSAKRPEVMAAVAAMAAKTFATYPILLFCGREAIVSLASEACSFREGDGDSEGVGGSGSNIDNDESGGGGCTKRIFFRLFRPALVTAWFAASLAAALLVPNIGQVIQQLGSLAAVFILVLPGLALVGTSLKAADSADEDDDAPLLVEEDDEDHHGGTAPPTRPPHASVWRKVSSWLGVAVGIVFVAVGAFVFGVVVTQGLEGQGGGKEPPICY